MKASLENKGAAAGATSLAVGADQTGCGSAPPVLLSPAHEDVDSQGLLEFQSHHCCPGAAISENPFWVRGFAFTTLQSRRLKPREKKECTQVTQLRSGKLGWTWGMAGPKKPWFSL